MIKFSIFCSILVLLIIYKSVEVNGQYFCRSTGKFRGNSPPAGQCSTNCCVQDQVYFTFECSPEVTNQTMGVLTLRIFPSGRFVSRLCDHQYHSDNDRVVALSTGWYNGGTRCGKGILVTANGKTVKARVVDECDSTKGCEATEKYHPPCGYNVVAASRSVWDALGVPLSQRTAPLGITWADA